MRHLTTAPFALFIILGSACGTKTQDTTLATYERQRAAQADSSHASCTCYASGGFASESACLAATQLAPLTAEQRACLITVFTNSGDVLNPTYECRAQALEAANACARAVAGCDTVATSACLTALQTALMACPAADVAAQGAVDVCVPPPVPPGP